MVPLGQAEELLHGLGRDIGGRCDRLDALAGQVRELALDINGQVRAGALMRKAIVEALEEPADSRAQTNDLVGCLVRMAPYEAFPT
jgi:hypothetical protein